MPEGFSGTWTSLPQIHFLPHTKRGTAASSASLLCCLFFQKPLSRFPYVWGEKQGDSASADAGVSGTGTLRCLCAKPPNRIALVKVVFRAVVGALPQTPAGALPLPPARGNCPLTLSRALLGFLSLQFPRGAFFSCLLVLRRNASLPALGGGGVAPNPSRGAAPAPCTGVPPLTLSRAPLGCFPLLFPRVTFFPFSPFFLFSFFPFP